MKKETYPSFPKSESNFRKRPTSVYDQIKLYDNKLFASGKYDNKNSNQSQKQNQELNIDLTHSKYEPPFSRYKKEDNGLYQKVKYYDNIILCHKPRVRTSIALNNPIALFSRYPLKEDCVNRNVKDYLTPSKSNFDFSYYSFIKQSLKTPIVATRRKTITQQIPKAKIIEVKDERSYCYYSTDNDLSINCENEDENESESESNNKFESSNYKLTERSRASNNAMC